MQYGATFYSQPLDPLNIAALTRPIDRIVRRWDLNHGVVTFPHGLGLPHAAKTIIGFHSSVLFAAAT